MNKRNSIRFLTLSCLLTITLATPEPIQAQFLPRAQSDTTNCPYIEKMVNISNRYFVQIWYCKKDEQMYLNGAEIRDNLGQITPKQKFVISYLNKNGEVIESVIVIGEVGQRRFDSTSSITLPANTSNFSVKILR